MQAHAPVFHVHIGLACVGVRVQRATKKDATTEDFLSSQLHVAEGCTHCKKLYVVWDARNVLEVLLEKYGFRH
jgi:hypothetical protein